MRVAKYLEVKELSVYVDSQLVANQFNGIFEAHDESMQKYLKLVQELAVDFNLFQITQVSRTLNKKADALSKLAALTFSHFKKEIWLEEVKVKSIETDSVSTAIEEEEQNWMTPIVEFLNKGTLPIDSIESKKIKMKAPMYLLDKGILYRKSFLGPHLRCLNPIQAESIIQEVHEGMYALHSGHKTVVSKIMRLGYYWPSMYRDATKVIRKCQSYQLHAPVSKAPRHPMIPVVTPWPFCKWAIDLVGPFPAGPGGVKFLVVAIAYFTKWVEAKPLKTISGKQIRNFVWENIVCQFGIPNEIFSDNGTQFEGNPFSDWCQELNIKQTFISVAHPQANGQCEVTNRDIGLGIKARLRLCRRGWIDELLNVLWVHHTTPKGVTNETPFSLMYGSEAVILAEINVPTMQIASFDESSNSEELRENLNLVEERREMAAIKEAINKKRIASYYNKRVQPFSFQLDDLVWRKNEASRAEDTGKLRPKWEGQYKVIGVSDTGAYRLASLDGKAIKRTWHAQTLKRCYI
ncbi:uncharacterized protein [Rutidosis leptorrhynchoides]|uniref:uncharacterized protein n=1 Tax=Rutidosis leptorrhynchoides TaxID=125765 RepID=UPI003A999841